MDKAVTEIIAGKGVLSKLLEEHRAEVMDLCITEYNEELHEKTLREEGRLEAEAKAEKEKREIEAKAEKERLEMLRKMIDNGAEKEFILKVGYGEEEYERVLKKDY